MRMSQDVHVTSSNIHVNPERSFGGTNERGATERSEQNSEGGSGGPPPEKLKNLDGKWCNLRYS